jgi:AraC family transcriptional activator of pobA
MVQKGIEHLSSSDYIRLFLEKADSPNSPRKMIQSYDYRQLCKVMKTPTSVFIPGYNYLLYIEKGYVLKQIDNQVREINKGSIVFMQSGQITSLLKVSENIAGTIVIFENEVWNEIFTQQNLPALFFLTPLLQLPKDNEQKLATLMQLLLKEHEGVSPVSRYAVCLLQAIFQKLVEIAPTGKTSYRNYAVAVKFKELVHNNFIQSKKVSFYAGKLAITENYLNRCVTEVLNSSAKNYILITVASQAKLLLQDADQSISDIAYALNFEDPSHFAKLFRKITGISPGEYKRSMQV